jgi:hypothetical protein
MSLPDCDRASDRRGGRAGVIDIGNVILNQFIEALQFCLCLIEDKLNTPAT